MSKLCGSEKSYNIFYTVTSWQLTLTQIVCFRQCPPLSKETSQDERCGGKVRSLGNAHLFLYDRLGQNGLSKTTTQCWKAQSCYAKTFNKIIRFSSFMEYNVSFKYYPSLVCISLGKLRASGLFVYILKRDFWQNQLNWKVLTDRLILHPRPMQMALDGDAKSSCNLDELNSKHLTESIKFKAFDRSLDSAWHLLRTRK